MSIKRSLTTMLCAALIGTAASSVAWLPSLAIADTEPYNPKIDPLNFVAEISNKYFTLKPGKKFEFKNSAGSERIEISITQETKKILGVTTTVVRATEWKNGVLKEDTRDWYAQDKDGNVWYFGEAVDNYVDGKLNNHAGSWEAGIGGALPGIIMLANPKVGDTYRQEYYKGKAEDMGTITALAMKVTTPLGTFDDCVQIKDWSQIEAASEFKYYCPGPGFLVLEESTVPGGGKVNLVRIFND
jgi:hypothetical protein